MNWSPIDVSDNHQDALGSYDVVGALEGRVPWVQESAKVYYTEERSLDVLEEFIIRCLVELKPVQGSGEVSEILGLGDDRFVEPIIGELDRMQLLETDEEGYRPTDELEEANKKGIWVDQYEQEITCTCNPFTGKRVGGQLHFLEKENSAPTNNLPEEELGEGKFKQWLVGDSGPLRGADITRVEFKRREVLWQPVHLLLFEDHHESTWGWEPYAPNRGNVVVSYRSACESFDATEAAQSYLSSEISDSSLVATTEPSKKRSTELEPLSDRRNLAQKEFVRRYGTKEAAGRINRSISDAESEVLISFPWIKKPALTSALTGALESTLEDGAFVYIGYGISGSKDKENTHHDAIRELRSLDSNQDGSIRVVWTGESHVKEIVIDRHEYIGGSFNRLSFRGDPDQETGNIRRESMIHTNASSVVENSVREFVPCLKNGLAKQASQCEFESYSKWRRKWRPLFRLGARSNDVESALRALPNTGRKRVSAIREILTQYQSGGGVHPSGLFESVIGSTFVEDIQTNEDLQEDLLEVLEAFESEWEIDRTGFSVE